MKTHEVIIINECRLPRGGTLFTYSVLQTFLWISFVSKVFRTFAAYMRRLPHILLCLWALCMLIGCAGDGYTPALRTADSLMNDSPSVALAMLDSLKGEAQGWSKAQRMRYHLLTMKAQNKAYVDFTSDSLAKEVVEYYDNHGTANDRLLAHYLLGCVYRDFGEAPKALQAYYDALEKIDTLTINCDANTLAWVYGQMSQVFHQQDLPYDEIWALRHYSKCIERTGDTRRTIIAKSQLVRPYYLLGEKDSVLKLIGESYQTLKLIGDNQSAAEMLPTAIFIYTERKDLLMAGQMVDAYEKESGLFDEKGNIAKGREHYYVTKGFYKLAIHEIDSAEAYFRKAIHSGFLSDGYKGLLSVYRQKNVLDSIVHFSQLFEDAQDSLHNNMQIEAIHQMSSLYNYNRSLKEAEQEAQKTRNARMWLGIVIITVFLCIMISYYYYCRYKERKQNEIRKLGKELASAKKEYQSVQSELQMLKKKDYKNLIAQKELRGFELKETIANLSGGHEESIVYDSLEQFEASKIVEVFRKKKNFKSDNPIPNKSEWRALELQFSKDMPSTYKILSTDKKLSPLELQICILLILDFDEASIVSLTNSMPQTISTSKTRANKKLFNAKGATTLKSGLLQLIKGPLT